MIMDMREDQSEILHYDIPDNPIFFRNNEIPGWYDFCEEFLHWHDEVEFIYVYEGSVWYQVNDKHIHLACGEGIFVNSRQLHVISSDCVDTKLYCLIIHPTILCASSHIAKNFVEPVINHKGIPYIKFSDQISWNKILLEDIAKINVDYEKKEQKDCGNDLSIMGHLFHIWQGIYENVSFAEEGKEERIGCTNLSMVKAMISFVQEHYSEKIGLKEICQAGMVGKTKVTSLFARYLNTSPMQYLNQYRLEQSIQLLIHSDKSITEIASDCGFSDNSYYSKLFRNRFGLKPLEFRKRGESHA